MVKQKIIVIVGPTAVGKTSFSIDIAKEFKGEVISGDSMQIYKDLTIGTAKVTPEEMNGIPHHLVDFKNVDQAYDVSDFQKDAKIKIKEIAQRGHLPIVVGGSGLYIESLLYSVSHGEAAEPNYALREELERFAKVKGNQSLWEKLNEIDPVAADKIHPNNVRRTVRVIEVYKETGQLFSSFQDEKKNKESEFNPFIICLNTERELLYERINKRVDLMVDQGLLDEAQKLWDLMGPKPEVQSTKAIGYTELFSYFNNEITLEEAIEDIKQNSRRYAKRQLTWFRNRLENVHWFDFVTEPEEVNVCISQIKSFLKDE